MKHTLKFAFLALLIAGSIDFSYAQNKELKFGKEMNLAHVTGDAKIKDNEIKWINVNTAAKIKTS